MYSETKPIIFNCPKEYETVELFPIHDLHYGNECFNLSKWNRLHDLILSEPTDHSRGKLVYDSRNHAVSFKSVEVLNCGAFLSYGGYGAAAGYRPKSDKLYKLVLHGGEKRIETVGFYL